MQVNATFGQSQGAPTLDGAASPAALVKDATTATFRTDVVAESAKQPVLVDFWAPWCGPCKQLTPIIEKQVKAANGKVKLVKMNIDEHPQIPGQLGIKSIPAVIAFVNGQPVDGFMGALPESQVKAFIDRVAGPGGADPLEDALAEAGELMESGDAVGAAQLYGAILTQEPGNLKALAGLARIHLSMGDAAQAKQLLAGLPPEADKDAGIQSVKAGIELAEQQAGLGDVAELEAKVAANPDDHQARIDLAIALNGRNKRDEAVDELIASIGKNRAWNEEAARKQLLQFFEAWGFKDEASIAGRRKLSTILYS